MPKTRKVCVRVSPELEDRLDFLKNFKGGISGWFTNKLKEVVVDPSKIPKI